MRTLTLAFLLSITSLIETHAATPAQVIVIRHAEKPESGNQLNVQGV